MGLVLAVLVPSVEIHAASFTADAVQIRGKDISHAKMFWLDGDVRFEYTEDGISMAQIFDNKNNKTIWLDNKNKHYLSKDIAEIEKVSLRSEKINPCLKFVDAECVFLKKVKLNGRAVEKWLVTLSVNESDFHIFQWIDSKYKHVLRQENSDGTGLTVEILDNQEINNRKVRKLTMTAFSTTGEKQQGTQWYDNELDVVVKQEYRKDVIDELRNIKLGKVSKAMFTIPDDYELYKYSLNNEKKLEDAMIVGVTNKN